MPGLADTVHRILDGDLSEVAPTIERQTIDIACDFEGRPVRLYPQCGVMLIAGSSGGGRSTTATALLEKIVEQGFQLCVIDPEGDYADLESALVIGDAKSSPRLPEIIELLKEPAQNAVVNLLSVDFPNRPRFLSELMPDLSRLRIETARPHWLVIDEAHHLLPSEWKGASLVLPQRLPAAILIAVESDHIAAGALLGVECVLALGARLPRC